MSLKSRDVTGLFNEGTLAAPNENAGAASSVANAEVRNGAVPVFDPLGFFERITDGRVHDPVRKQVMKGLEQARSYFRFAGNHP